MDLWGNVKLPVYRYIENSTSDEWQVISNATSDNVTCASLISIPITRPPLDGSSTFTINARQFDLTCDSNEGLNTNMTDIGGTATWKLKLRTSDKCNNYMAANCVVPRYPCPILSESLANGDPVAYSTANCSLTFDKFEAGVRCNGISCAVYKMRKLELLDAGYDAGMGAFTRRNYLNNLMVYMLRRDNYNMGSAGARGFTNMEKWMMNPPDFIAVRYDNVDLWRLSPELFGERLMILYNTFWQSTYGTGALGGNLPDNLTETGMMVGTGYGSNITFKAVGANIIRQTKPAYRINWKWFTALLVCSIILLAAAYVSLVLK
jgi:hypothetical protein